MKILIITIVLVSFIIYAALIFVILKLRSNSKFNEIQLLKMLRQLRYGQLNIDLSAFKNENIKTASEKLLDTLQDREDMILEYKHILTEKNKSLEKMIEIEKESQKFKDDFVAALTHDIKTPVIAELNAIKMLLNENFGKLTEPQIQVLKMMQASDEDLISLTELLTQTYKFQEAEVELNKEKVEVCSFAKQIFNELSPIFASKQQKTVSDISDEELYVQADKLHFKRVLQNLIMNAAKYGFNNSEIALKIYGQDKHVCINVTNEGDMINPEDVKLIFQKYYSGIKKFEQLGTGLGLYCANKIVTAHGGTIDVVSENNKTTFFIRLALDE